MGYLSFQIIFFLLLAALLGFIIGWLLRGNRFQTELQDLDNRWRGKLGDVESERDRFVTELTQANESNAKLEAEIKRMSSSDEVAMGMKADLASRDDELKKLRAELADLQTSNGDADLAAANDRAAGLESALEDARNANTDCKNEVERLKTEIAALRQGGDGAGSASAGGTMGLMSSPGAGTSSPSSTSTDTGGSAASGSGSGDAAESDTGRAGSGVGLRSIEGGGGQFGGSDSSRDQRAASPSHLAEADGQGFGGADTSSSGGAATGGVLAAGGSEAEEEGEKPEPLTEPRGGKADDLKLISGVGPKLERTLNGLGIYHFAQIADFSRENVAWVDRHLRFKGRIDREKWIEQAKVLAEGGETDFSKRQH